MPVSERLNASYAFRKDEFDFWRNGPEDYLCMVARTLTNTMERKGGIGPFVFSCDCINLGDVHVVHCEELTDA